MPHLFCFGLGYSALTLAEHLHAEGWRVSGTVRAPDKAAALRERGISASVFGAPVPDLAHASHVLASIPPGADGDPALRAYAREIGAAPGLAWLGYLSTIGVYGDRDGAWVDETDAPDLAEPRAARRAEAEAQWLAMGNASRPAHVFRLGGIYGPGRNALVQVAAGRARLVDRPGQVFNRIHVADIARTLRASIARPRDGGIYNVVDGQPSSPHEPILYAAALLGMTPPPETSLDDAEMSPMGRAFYSSNRRVRNDRLREELGVTLAYPTYREGLDALLGAGEGNRRGAVA